MKLNCLIWTNGIYKNGFSSKAFLTHNIKYSCKAGLAILALYAVLYWKFA